MRYKRYREFVAHAQCANCNGVCNAESGRSFVWVYYPQGANPSSHAEAQGFCSAKCRKEWRARNAAEVTT
jgi:hypothetical protein